MTGFEAVERALVLLNYTDSYGNASAKQNSELLQRSVPVINHILADILYIMGRPPVQITTANDELPVSDDVAVRVLVPGVAMLFCQSESDGDNQQLHSTLYNQARATLPRAAERRQDVLPRPIV